MGGQSQPPLARTRRRESGTSRPCCEINFRGEGGDSKFRLDANRISAGSLRPRLIFLPRPPCATVHCQNGRNIYLPIHHQLLSRLAPSRQACYNLRRPAGVVHVAGSRTQRLRVFERLKFQLVPLAKTLPSRPVPTQLTCVTAAGHVTRGWPCRNRSTEPTRARGRLLRAAV
jgi:hypothetical protein